MTDAEGWTAQARGGLWFVPTVTAGPFSWLDPPAGLEPTQGGPSEPGIRLQGWTSYPLDRAHHPGGP